MQVNGSPDGVDFGSDAEKNEQDDEPVDRIAFGLVGQREELVESVPPYRAHIDREHDRSHDDQIALDPALTLELTA
jgi:hypothetical protein